ncbi:hypothetical protein HDU87_003199 [Geranomyces variabilis]|uniref:Chromo domain-containing protein n=1 Tax=Geranomyces variabilis TaxID=109894 RepID=A0AAD5TKR2_9FUNG|nr:hypothetical protein HDU87_003199 [Geranomyces variabilis]
MLMGPAATGSPQDPTLASKRRRSFQDAEVESDVIASFSSPGEEFTYYIMERERMRLKKCTTGEKGRLTRNPVLRDFHFCNNRREDDRTSIVMGKVFEGRSRHHPQYLWNVILHRLLSKAWVNTALGFVEDLDVAIKTLKQYDTESARRENGTWRTSAFISSTPFHDFISNMRANWKLSQAAGRKIFGTPDAPLTTSFEHTCAIMRGFKGVGLFHTVQTALDLIMYGAGVAQPRQIDPGPGAVKALQLLSYATYSDQAKRDAVADLTKTLNRALKVHLANLDTADVLRGETLHMRLQDTEHALCEYQKYVAVAAYCGGRKKGGAALRRYKSLSGDRLVTSLAWADGDGMESHVPLSSAADSPPAARRRPSRLSADSAPTAQRPVRACVATVKVQQYLESGDSDDNGDIISSSGGESASSSDDYSPPAARLHCRPSAESPPAPRRPVSAGVTAADDDLIIIDYTPAPRVVHPPKNDTESDDSSSSVASQLALARQSTSSTNSPLATRRPVRACVATSSTDAYKVDDDDADDDLIITSFTPAPRVVNVTTAAPRIRPARASLPTPKMEQYLALEGLYRIDKILAERASATFGTEYHVLWAGYPLEGATWEPCGNLEDTEALEVWENNAGKREKERLTPTRRK